MGAQGKSCSENLLNSLQMSEFSFSEAIGVKPVTMFNEDSARGVFQEFLRDFLECISVTTSCCFFFMF